MSIRADVYMVQSNLAPSRERAQALIMAGVVFADGKRVDKAGMPVSENAVIEIKDDPIPFVSRGGLKLKKAVEVFPINLKDKVVADIGASTGGFTDCMLQNGAAKVYAIDVGYGQLDWSLRNDEHVCVMERTNARFMEAGWFEPIPEFASIDVSFISLKLILPSLIGCLQDGGEVVALIKPQFEAGRSEVGKNGVVRDASIHEAVCQRTIEFAAATGFFVAGLSFSPVTGPKGNIEFLMFLRKNGLSGSISEEIDVHAVVCRAHDSLKQKGNE